MPSISILAYKRFKWHLPIRPSRLLSNKFSIIKKEGGPVLIWKTRDMDKEKIIYKKNKRDETRFNSFKYPIWTGWNSVYVH